MPPHFPSQRHQACFFHPAMRIAISTADERISPVFDVAGRLLVVDVTGDRELRRTEVLLEDGALAARARQVADLSVQVLICGAISRPLELMLASAGVQVRPHTCGEVEEILHAFCSGQLTEEAFVMPGCCGRRRRFRGGRE